MLRTAVLLLLLCCFAPLAACRDEGPQPTVFTVSDKVLVRDVMRFGLNLGDDIWYAGAALMRERLPHGGFEGVLLRQITWGPEGGGDWMTDWHQLEKWQGAFAGVAARYVTGPRAGEDMRVLRVESAPHPGKPAEPPLPRFIFDTVGPAPSAAEGLLLDASRPDAGYVGQHGGAWWVVTDGDAAVRTAPDVRPGSRGRSSVRMDAAKSVAEILAPALSPRFDNPAGTWRLTFWAKGEGEAMAYCGGFSRRGENAYAFERFVPQADWQRFSLDFILPEGRVPADAPMLAAGLRVTGGRLWVDEASFVRLGEDGPTAFRPVLVKTLKAVRPGVLRHLQLGGSSMANIVAPRAERMAFDSSRGDAPPDGAWPGHPDSGGRARTHSYGLHEFLELCAEVGSTPWYCVPGTFTVEEMRALVEYLAGPPDSEWGRVRAERGRAAPWTDAFDAVRIEIGNEAWNETYPFQLAGYSRKGEYWERLFAAAKGSPYWTPRIVLNAAGQAVNPERNARIAREVPSADAFAVAPYLLHELPKSWAEQGDEELFARVFAAPYSEAVRRGPRETARDLAASDRELCVYEVNHHITAGDAAEEPRNKIAAGLGGGLNVTSWMLEMLSRWGVRAQCLFTLAQFSQPLDGGGAVRLWGAVSELGDDPGRWRPTLLGMVTANRMLTGDMVEIVRGGPDMGKTVQADFGAGRETVRFPFLRCYATRAEGRIGVAMINVHPWAPLPVLLRDAGGEAFDGTMVRLSGPGPDADNEPEHEPAVVMEESSVRWTEEGLAMTLPPQSMTVITGVRR